MQKKPELTRFELNTKYYRVHSLYFIVLYIIAKKECFNKNKKIPVKALVIEVNRYKDTFRLYYIFTNNKEIKNERNYCNIDDLFRSFSSKRGILGMVRYITNLENI